MSKKQLETKTTQRGFSVITFADQYGKECSLQKSRLGCDDPTHYDKGTMPIKLPSVVYSCAARMHLDRDQAKWLIRQLKYFVQTGEVKEVE